MRVLINYATYADRVTIHCLAGDAHTVLAPFKLVSSLETLYRLIKYVGGDPDQCRTEIKTWGHGGCWAELFGRSIVRYLVLQRCVDLQHCGGPGQVVLTSA
jgi:hypothetical protein